MPRKPNNPIKKTNVKDQWALNSKGYLKGDEWAEDDLALSKHHEKQRRRDKIAKDARKKNRGNV